MARKFPKQVVLDADEVTRLNRIRVAKWLGVTPSAVDEMPAEDVEDIFQVMWADNEK